MEFPHLGANCSVSSCNKLDFLPMKCDGCKTLFCGDHFAYVAHSCPGGRRDVQVPSCPLCGAAVPGRRGEAPDVAVGAHIDNDCRSDPAVGRRAKVFAHRCSRADCRGKELMPLTCPVCSLNYCVKHRHPADHDCRPASQRTRAARAADSRLKAGSVGVTVRTHASTVADIQGNMTEDEALAHALSLSLQSEQVRQPQRVGGDSNNRCSLS